MQFDKFFGWDAIDAFRQQEREAKRRIRQIERENKRAEFEARCVPLMREEIRLEVNNARSRVNWNEY